MPEFSHLDERGSARMVDVTAKADTSRTALAQAEVQLAAETIQLLRDGRIPKGDALAVARIAGISAAKKTSELIPLCHPLSITGITVDLAIEDNRVVIHSTVSVTGKTGVEMEALTAVSVAALALYDMVKSVDRSAVITDIELEHKSGGKSGEYKRS